MKGDESVSLRRFLHPELFKVKVKKEEVEDEELIEEQSESEVDKDDSVSLSE